MGAGSLPVSLIATGAFGFFVVCPRLAAMTSLIATNFKLPIYWLVAMGTIASLPLLLVMTWLIRQWGMMAGLGFAVFTDLLAALTLSSVNLKAAVETFIIALFVLAGSRVAGWLTAWLF